MRTEALLLAASTSQLLAGCAHENDDRREAVPTPKHRAQCVVSDAEGEIILHPGSITPTGDLTLVDVDLEGALNREVIERDVVRFTGRAGVQGIIRDYPPLKTARLVDSLADWDQRGPLAGIGLGPDDEQQAVLVAIRLSDPSVSGHLDGVRLRSDGGEQAFAQSMLVEPPGALCTVSEVERTLDWVQ